MAQYVARLARWFVVGLWASVGAVNAAELDQAALTKTLQAAIPKLQITRIVPSPVDGIAEVISNNEQRLYVSYDGKHFFAGDLFSIEAGRLQNLTESMREKERADELHAIPDKDMIVFSPDNPKATIYVFTDIDCGYCRKLHSEIGELNALGVRVNYLAFPRAGIGSESYDKAVSAWCAKDPKQALTDAKAGKPIKSIACTNPVAAQMQIGERMGVSGTPAIVLETGQLVPGYVPAEKLAAGLGIN